MSDPVPAIYAPPAKPLRLSPYERLIALAVAGACAFVIYHAITLTPAPEGYGTHRAMGFLACNMIRATGIPCPTCGMTTSFAWFYRGNLLASAYVQPAGFAAAYFTAMLLPMALYEAATGRPIHRMLRVLKARFWIAAGLALFATGWIWKIVIHVTGHDGW